MPSKYQKMVLLFSLGIMLIGFCTFSIVSPGFSLSFASRPLDDKNVSKGASFGAVRTVEGKTETETQTELENLVGRYFAAKQQVDMDAIETCVSDVKQVEEKKLLAESEYVESYENIQCKVLDASKEGAYRVYVYYEVKIYDIDTLLPSLTALYVTMDENDTFQIYLGTLGSEEQQCVDELDESDQVKELITTVQNRLSDVLSSDSEAQDFFEMLESV